VYYLFEHPGEIVPRLDLVEYLWDNEIHIDDNTLSVNIMRIREKLRSLGRGELIQTKRGMGYKI
jgi:DNA-binding response OmpR family regulator